MAIALIVKVIREVDFGAGTLTVRLVELDQLEELPKECVSNAPLNTTIVCNDSDGRKRNVYIRASQNRNIYFNIEYILERELEVLTKLLLPMLYIYRLV